MASNTSNVKMGVCKVIYKGVDLGYTKGGVSVDVTTSTHPITIDQFGESIINEYITKREIKVTCPLAETTLENLALTMPGATLNKTGATQATGTINIVSVPAALDTITLNGVTFTYRTTAAATVASTDIFIGATPTVTTAAAATAAAINAFVGDYVTDISATAAIGVVTLTYDTYGVVGNSFTLAKLSATSTAITLNALANTVLASTLSGGADPTVANGKRVDVTNGVEQASLLSIAGQLTLHPIANKNDPFDDLVIPLAGTAGGMKFAYQYNSERIFNVEFHGYPDSASKILFKLGSSLATSA